MKRKLSRPPLGRFLWEQNVSSVWQNQRVEWSKAVLVDVEASPVGSKSPAVVVVCISKGEKHEYQGIIP